MRVFVLGSSGMLGCYVYKYLNQEGYNVVSVNRDRLDASIPDYYDVKQLGITQGDVVINCMGLIPHRKDINDVEFLLVNSVFPRVVADVCAEVGADFIHTTTDCFLPNTDVKTISGVKQIKDMKIGDIVYTHTGDLKPVYELKKKFISDEIFKIDVLSSLPVKCTKNHPFYCIKREKKQLPNFSTIDWVYAENLNEGDLISIPKLKLPKKSLDSIDLLEYSAKYRAIVEEYTYFENNIKGVIFNNFKKYCIDNELNYRKMIIWKNNLNIKPKVCNLDRYVRINTNMMWFIGLFLADGWVDNGQWRKSIHITIQDEDDLVKKTMSIIEKEFKVKPNIRYIKKQKSCEIYFTHQLLSEMLAKDFYISLEHYSHTKNIPQWIKKTGRDNIISFIKGYFDGDGCFYNKNGSCFFSASTVSKSLSDELITLLMFIGILPSIVLQKRKGLEKIDGREVRVRDAYKIQISGKQVGKLINLFGVENSNYNIKKRYQKFFEDENNWYVPIEKITKEIYNGYVYNLEVEEDHSYLISNGLSAHNCVFNGAEGGYVESSPHTAMDIYGRSKSLGESESATIIRTSIIGEELSNKLSLVEWVKSQAGKSVNGYLNHFWNGITCLQFAKICDYMLKNDLFWKGVKHIHSPNKISKFGLILAISNIYELGVEVKEFKTPEKCDRSLKSERTNVLIEVPGLYDQIKEMKEFKI
jgi:dTDP-4-dehydrorhamnose reductase/intein/homing endonuclease